MPLVRYEVRCEHSLANPELYRSAARDDPESLLEGVAMAGLVGIVRQLGDLAEFASEIFCSLHDELMTLGSRGHDLNMRVQQLEDELPAVEKALLSEPNQLRFAYTNGADWHASIRSDQNHCTSGDLPRFVRNYYEECRGPPQLFLLDKFDVSGVGACLKRYTDPSFFKLEWASTELKRAQREQRDKKARRDKKKGRNRRTGQPIAAINQIPARVRYGSASLEDLEGLPHDIASAFNIEVPVPSRLGPNRGFDTQTPRGLPRGSLLAEDSSLPALRPIQGSAVSNITEEVKYSKISARDTGSGNDSGNGSKPSEPEGTIGSMAGRITRIIDLEDRAAAPATGYTRALDTKGLEPVDGLGGAVDTGQVLHVDSKATNGISRENSGAAAMPRSVKTPVGTPRGTARGEFSMDVREGAKPISGNIPVGAGSPTLPKSSSRINVYMDALDTGRLSGKFLWKNNVDGGESSALGGRSSRQISMARSGSEFDEFVDAPSRIGSEGDGAGSDFDSPGSGHRVTHFNGDALNHAALKHHVEAQNAYIPSGMKLMEQQQPLPISGKLSDVSERENVERTDNINPGAPSPIPTLLNEDLPAFSPSSGPSDTPAGDAPALVQQSGAQKAESRSAELLKALSSNGNVDSYIQVAPVVDIPRKTEKSNLLSSMATSPTHSSLGSSPNATSPTHAGQDILLPSVSMFSRHSYSSELISVSSDSEPNSPTSPNSPSSRNSPAFHALYSPRGSPPRESDYTVQSPPTTYLGSYSPGAHKSNQSSPSLDEVPVLSESPTSFSRSPKRDLALVGYSLPPLGTPVKSEPLHLPSGPRLQPYPLPTPPMSPERDNPEHSKSRAFSDSITGRVGGPTSPGQNGESGHTRFSDEDDVHPALQLSITSKRDVMNRLKEPANLDEPVPPVIRSNTGVAPSSPLCGTPRYSAFSESTRSSLLLPSRVVDSPGSSAPSTPHGSPKKSFQRIFLSSPSVLASSSPLRNTSDDATRCRSLGDEDSASSSPSGSVIIKDSPPESPRSSYTGSECESRDFDAIQGRPQTSGSTGLSNAMEASVLNREAYVDEVASIASLRSKTSETAAKTCPEQVQSLLSSPTSHSSLKHSEVAVDTSAQFSLDSCVSNGSADHSVSQKKILPSIRSPSIVPEVDPLPATLKPISTARSTTKSYKSLTSNSPPDSPGRMNQSSNKQWRGKAVPPSTPPRAAFKLPHHPPLRSPLRSPLHTPRSFFSETGTLKWLGRLDPGLSPTPDFSLPPNLVNHSETSSPACSPSPQLDLDSPPPHVYKGGEDEEYRLSDLPNPLASTSFVNADGSSFFRHDSEEDYNDENIRQSEPQRVELSAASNSGPSHSSSSSFDDVPSSKAGGLEEIHVLTKVAEIEQLSVPVGRAVSKQPLPATSWASVTALDKENGVGSYHVIEVDVDEVDQSIEQSRVSSSREAEDTQELDLLRNADAEVQSTDSKQASPSLFEESESSSEFEHASDGRVFVAAQRDQDEVSESIHEHFDEGDVCVAAHATEKASLSPLDNEERTLNFEPVNGADIVGAAPANEKASASPLERAERSLDLELVNETNFCVAAHASEKASSSPLENGERTLDFEPVNEVDFDGAAPASEKATSPLEKIEHRVDFELVNEADADCAARFQGQLPLSPSQVTDLTRNSVPETNMDSSIAAQSNEEALPSLSTPKLDNSDESVALNSAEVITKVHSIDSPSPVPEFELRTTPNTKDALEAAIAQHDRNMLKVLTFQEPALKPPPPPDERSLFSDQMRTTSFNLRRNEGLENIPSIPRPVANINVAAILEKANAIRQAFAGSDDDDDGEDDWSDS